MRPQLMPELRESLHSWMGPGTGGESWMGICCEGGQFHPIPRQRAFGPRVAAGERERLRRADLYSVTGDMTALALTAAHSLPDYRLRASDLPSDYGLLIYDQTIRSLDGLEYMGCSWGPSAHWFGDPEWAGWGVAIVWYLAINDQRTFRVADGNPVIPEQLMLIPYNDDGEIRLEYARSSNDDDPDLMKRTLDESEWPAKQKTLLTTWLMMQQTVASVASEYVDRPARRRLARNGVTDPALIRVVTLRHKTTHSTGASDREYHHRWMVKGHWRNQWYPSQERHVPLWIHPHMKGPDGAPILGGEKVYAWTR